MVDNRTGTDRFSHWGIDDAVIRLRSWASDNIHNLPTPPQDVMVGSSDGCPIRVADPLVSREHARLTCVDGRWFAIDLSKNGTHLDGVRTRTFALTPGSEIRVGGSTMLAESARFVELRMFVGRILGWTVGRLEAVDSALRAIRRASLRRSALYLSGDIDLVPIAHSIHRHVWGSDRPFVTCDPRRGDADESVRSVANKTTGLAAYDAAVGGSVCVRSERLPPDFPMLLERLRAAESHALLVVVGNDSRDRHDADVALNPAVHVPPVAERTDELPLVIDHYALNAAEELHLPDTTFTSEDRAWVLAHAATSLNEIEKATLRLTALRASRSISDAAARLRMAPVSLSRWLGRRELPLS